MKRRLFNLAALLSLSMCLGCLFMWVRSGLTSDVLRRGSSDGGRILIGSTAGEMTFIITVVANREVPPRINWRETPWGWDTNQDIFDGGRGQGPGGTWKWDWPTYSAGHVLSPPSGDLYLERVLVIPYWLPVLIAVIHPSLWFWRQIKRRRLNRRGFEVSPAPASAPATSRGTETSS